MADLVADALQQCAQSGRAGGYFTVVRQSVDQIHDEWELGPGIVDLFQNALVAQGPVQRRTTLQLVAHQRLQQGVELP